MIHVHADLAIGSVELNAGVIGFVPSYLSEVRTHQMLFEIAGDRWVCEKGELDRARSIASQDTFMFFEQPPCDLSTDKICSLFQIS